MKKTAIIVGRKGSHRIPKKIYQLIDGESLLLRKVRQCMAANIDQVVVGVDDESLRNQVEGLGAKFCLMPDEFCQGNNPSGMIKNILSFFESDVVLWAHPTNPFITHNEYNDALETLESLHSSGYDSLFSVKKMNGHFWSQHPTPINFSPMATTHKLATQLPSLFAQDGGIFIRPYRDMARDGLFVSGKAHMYALDELVGWDIDYPWQLEFAQQWATNGRLL